MKIFCLDTGNNSIDMENLYYDIITRLMGQFYARQSPLTTHAKAKLRAAMHTYDTSLMFPHPIPSRHAWCRIPCLLYPGRNIPR